jgi:hypothetical protein
MRLASRPAVRRALAGGLAAGFLAAALALSREVAEPAQLAAAPEAAKVEAPPLFATWPKDRQPDLVIVLSGQMNGYLQ